MDRFTSCSWKPATPVMGLRSPTSGAAPNGTPTTTSRRQLRPLQLRQSHAYRRRRRRHCSMRRLCLLPQPAGMKDEAEMASCKRQRRDATGSISCSVSVSRHGVGGWQTVSRGFETAVHCSSPVCVFLCVLLLHILPTVALMLPWNTSVPLSQKN